MSREDYNTDNATNGAVEDSPTDAERRYQRTLALICIVGFGSAAVGALNATLGEYLGLQSAVEKVLLNFAITAVIFGPPLFWFTKKKW